MPQLLEYYRGLKNINGPIIAEETLKTVKTKLSDGIKEILPEVPVWLIEVGKLQKRCGELKESAKSAYPESTFLALDNLYFPGNENKLQVTRILDWDTKDLPAPVRSPGARPGFLPPKKQAAALADKGIKKVIIGDAGIFDGGTLKFVKSILNDSGIQIEAFVGAICGANASGITANMSIDLYTAIQLITGPYEWIEARDFFDGIVPGGGIVVGKKSKIDPEILKPYLKNGNPICVPYNRGFPGWSSIPTEKFEEFQNLCQGLRETIRIELGENLSKDIQPDDLVRISQAYFGQVRGEIPVSLDGSIFPTPISWIG